MSSLRVKFGARALLAISAALAGCTDAQREKMTNYGDEAKVTCYSGGIVIYDGISTGKISSEDNSDGYYFKDKETKKLVEVSGACVIRYNYKP